MPSPARDHSEIEGTPPVTFSFITCLETDDKIPIISLINLDNSCFEIMNRFVSSGKGGGGKRPFQGRKKEPDAPSFSFDLHCVWCRHLIKNQAIRKSGKYTVYKLTLQLA